MTFRRSVSTQCAKGLRKGGKGVCCKAAKKDVNKDANKDVNKDVNKPEFISPETFRGWDSD